MRRPIRQYEDQQRPCELAGLPGNAAAKATAAGLPNYGNRQESLESPTNPCKEVYVAPLRPHGALQRPGARTNQRDRERACSDVFAAPTKVSGGSAPDGDGVPPSGIPATIDPEI